MPSDRTQVHPPIRVWDIAFEIKRKKLMFSQYYIANPTFLRNTTWAAIGPSQSRVLYEAAGVAVKTCSVVGVISPLNMQLAPHGDFVISEDGTTPIRQFSDASLRFTLVPSDYPSFAMDFNTGVNTVLDALDVLHGYNGSGSPFMSMDNSGKVSSLRFRHKLFHKNRARSHVNPLFLSSLDDYLVDPKYSTHLRNISATHKAVYMQVRNADERYMYPIDHEACLVNKLVEIRFNLTYDVDIGVVASVEVIRLLKRGGLHGSSISSEA